MPKSKIGIVGTGPAALMAGYFCAKKGFEVHFYDHKKAAGRKFLVAGHGGFNLTNAKDIEDFVAHYNCELIQNAVRQYTNQDFIQFLHEIGIETFVGSSDKIFPLEGIKPIEVLDKWIEKLKSLHCEFHYETEMINFDNQSVTFKIKGILQQISFDNILFALGGSSWSVTGSDGKWIALFQKKNIETIPFKSSNAGFELKKEYLSAEYAGNWLKNIVLYSENQSRKGEITITDYGVEGIAVYALNASFRQGKTIYIDFKPSLTNFQIIDKIEKAKNITDALKGLKLAKIVRHWLKLALTKTEFTDSKLLTAYIKKYPLPIQGLRSVEESISTVGGISRNALNSSFRLNTYPNIFCIGEMVDWDAPTGGYLIQGCVSSGAKAGKAI